MDESELLAGGYCIWCGGHGCDRCKGTGEEENNDFWADGEE